MNAAHKQPAIIQLAALFLCLLIAALTTTAPPVAALKQNTRAVRVVSSAIAQGATTTTVAVELVAQGNENAVGFSLTFDTNVLSNAVVAAGSGLPTGAIFSPNTSQTGQGRIGIGLALQPGQTFAAGTRQLATITFNVAASASCVVAPLNFGDQPIARDVIDAEANTLTADFTAGNVAINSPAPTLASLSQTAALAGTAGLTLTVTGSNFVNCSVVRWNGAERATTFGSSTQLTAAISTADLATAGTASVTVFTPAPGGGASGAQTFTINNRTPTLSSLNPASAAAGGAAFTLTVTGANFVNGAVVKWNGADRTTAFVSATQLTAAISAADVAQAGAASVTVVNPAPGGGASNALSFNITGSTLAITAQPASQTVCAGAAATFSVTASGTNLSYQWRKNGNAIPNATGSSYTIAATAAGDAGNYTVVVSSGANSVPSNAAALTVNAATAINTQPVNQTVCASATATFTVAATGANLSYQWRRNGNALPNATAATLTLNNVTAAQAGSYDALVTGACGTATSAAATLTVNAAPNVTTQPVNQTVGAGNNATFTAAASGSPAPTVQWQVSVNGGASFSNINGATNATLTLNGVTAALSGYLYRAVFTNSCGTATSNAAVLTVGLATGAGNNVTVSTGQGQTITFANVSSPGVTIITPIPASSAGPLPGGFTLGGLNLAFEITTTAAFSGPVRLCFNAPQVNDPAVFQTLRVLHGEGNPLALVDRTVSRDFAARTICAEVTTLSPFVIAQVVNACTAPVVTTQPVNQTLLLGSNATFTAAANGSPAPTVQWQVSADGGVSFSNINGATNTTLTVTQVNNGNRYRAVFTNNCGTATSNAAVLTIFSLPDNPFPMLTSLNPAARPAGGGVFTLTVNGANFVNGAEVRWNGAGRATIFVNSSQVTAQIPASDSAIATTAVVTVFNPLPGGGISNALNFTISQPCSYTLQPTSQSFGANGGTGSVNVAAPAGCAWTASSNAAWLTINSNNNGSGNGAVNYTVAANNGAQRSGALNVAGQTFTVTQTGAPGATLANITPLSAPLPNKQFLARLDGGGFDPARLEIVITGPDCPAATPCVIPNGVLTEKSSASAVAPFTLNRGTFQIQVRNGRDAALSNSRAFTILPLATSVSAASFTGAEITAETIVSLFGNGLAAGTTVARGLPLPTALLGTSVKIKDSQGGERDAPLFFVSPTQINYLTPTGTVAGAATVIVRRDGAEVAIGQIQIADVAPGLFGANASGSGLAAGYLLRAPASSPQRTEAIARYDSAQNRFVAVPIVFGPTTEQLFLVLFGTGLRNRSSLAAVTVTIGGRPAEVLFAGAQGSQAGLDQVNVRLPRELAGRGEVNIVLTVNGKTANTVQVNVK